MQHQESRVDGVKKLVMFVSCLEWVRQTDGTYETCRQMRDILKRVLDKLIAPTTDSGVVNRLPPDTDAPFQFHDLSSSDLDLDLEAIMAMPDWLEWIQAPRAHSDSKQDSSYASMS